MKKKLARGIVMCLVGMSLVGCGNEAEPLAEYLQWMDKVHIGDTAEQVRQVMEIEPDKGRSYKTHYWYKIPCEVEGSKDMDLIIEFDDEVTSEESNVRDMTMRFSFEKGTTEEDYNAFFREWVRYFDAKYGESEDETNEKFGTAKSTWQDETGEYDRVILFADRYDEEKEHLGVTVFWYGSEYDSAPEGW